MKPGAKILEIGWRTCARCRLPTLHSREPGAARWECENCIRYERRATVGVLRFVFALLAVLCVVAAYKILIGG